MNTVFNDATTLQIQSASVKNGCLLIKTISATLDELRAKFSDELATKQMQIVERGQTIATYVDYTVLYRLEEYTGGILGVVMYKKQTTPEARAEVQAAAIAVAQIQAQSLADEQALSVQAIYPAWSGDGVVYTVDYKVLQDGVLYKCLQAHTSQSDWVPEAAPSLWSKVLIPTLETIPEWEQPDSANGYATGDKVMHSGKTWESLTDNNVWEPGVAGTETLWKEIDG